MITINEVSKRFGRRLALANVSLQVFPGEVTLLLGANGAGKSTLLRCLLGITDFEGRIRVAGRDPLTDGRSVRSLVGYMPQSGGLHEDLSVDETVAFYAAVRRVPIERGKTLLREAGLADHATAQVGDLSGGLRQRLGFALALLTDPPILVLDEPSASLDAASRRWLATKLRAAADEGRTVLVSTHAGQDLLDSGGRRIVLEEGRVSSDERFGPPTASEPASPEIQPTGGAVWPLAIKELRDAIGSRWLISYAALLATLGLVAASTGLESSSGLALQAYGRTTATLTNFCLLLSPLVAVLMGSSLIAGERERGTLEHLLALPLTRARLLMAKHVGLLIALTSATVAGFVPAGVLITWHAGTGVAAHYLLFPLIATLVGAAMAGTGTLVSVVSRTAVQAQGAAVFLWFAFVLLYDLLLMGSLAVAGMPAEALAACLLANPIDAARVLGVLALEPDLYLLGPAGAYLTARFSREGAALLLLLSLLAWIAGPLALALRTFRLPRASSRSRRTLIVSTAEEATLS